VAGLTGDLKQIFVIHGEEAQSLAFADTLHAMKPKAKVVVPAPRQTIEV